MNAPMLAVQVKTAGGPYAQVDLPPTFPGPGEVSVGTRACGMCEGDDLTRNGLSGTKLPRVPGHEIAGVVNGVGEGVELWNVGDEVAVGWSGGVDFTCEYCRRGDFGNCQGQSIVGLSYDGGFAENVVVPQDAVARLPVGMSFTDAAPLTCAGATAFNALRRSPAGPGDTVAIFGIGGVGHLAIQFAAKMGFRTLAVNRGVDGDEKLARRLGADEYVGTLDGTAGDAVHELGDAHVILDTVSEGALQGELLRGLKRSGRLVVLEGPDAIPVTGHDLATDRWSVSGRWFNSTAQDIEDTLNFAALKGIRPIVTTFPLWEAEEAYQSKADLRTVLVLQ